MQCYAASCGYWPPQACRIPLAALPCRQARSLASVVFKGCSLSVLQVTDGGDLRPPRMLQRKPSQTKGNVTCKNLRLTLTVLQITAGVSIGGMVAWQVLTVASQVFGRCCGTSREVSLDPVRLGHTRPHALWSAAAGCS